MSRKSNLDALKSIVCQHLGTVGSVALHIQKPGLILLGKQIVQDDARAVLMLGAADGCNR